MLRRWTQQTAGYRGSFTVGGVASESESVGLGPVSLRFAGRDVASVSESSVFAGCLGDAIVVRVCEEPLAESTFDTRVLSFAS